VWLDKKIKLSIRNISFYIVNRIEVETKKERK